MGKRPKIYYVKWLPSAKAITAPPFGIFIKTKYKGVKGIRIHELTHWRQYLRMGLLKFYWNYFKESLFNDYVHMPMEREAENRQKVFSRHKHYLKGREIFGEQG